MTRLLLVHPGAGAPEWCSLEVWQALSGRRIFADNGDAFGTRLSENGMDVLFLEAGRPVTTDGGEPDPVRKPSLRMIVGPHTHGQSPPWLQTLASRLARAAVEHGDVAYILPKESDPVVRAVLEHALSGEVEIEVVIGRSPRGHLLLELVRVMARLRGPGGCPWDAEQTHESLAKHLIDETYELLEAIEQGTPSDIAEELGDVLLQVVFHTQMGHDAQTFDIDDVVARLIEKLVARHPHVFAGTTVENADEVVRNWDEIKAKEKAAKQGSANASSVHDDIPDALPALAWTAKLQRRAGKAGFDWRDASGPFAKLAEEIAELQAATTDEEREDELGDVLLAAVAVSRHLGLDAETALRKAGRRFRDRVALLEEAARTQGLVLTELPDDELQRLWDEVKR